jgi:hypothetical protein
MNPTANVLKEAMSASGAGSAFQAVFAATPFPRPAAESANGGERTGAFGSAGQNGA